MSFTEDIINSLAVIKIASMNKKAETLDARGIPYEDVIKMSPKVMREIAHSVPKYDIIPVLDKSGNRYYLGSGVQGRAFPAFANPEAGFSDIFIDNPNPKLKQLGNAVGKVLHGNTDMADIMMGGNQKELLKHLMSGNSPYIGTLFPRGFFNTIGGKGVTVTEMLLNPEQLGMSRDSAEYRQIVNMWNRIMRSETIKNSRGRLVNQDLAPNNNWLDKLLLGENSLETGLLKDPVTGDKLYTIDVRDSDRLPNHNFAIHPATRRGLTYDPLVQQEDFSTKGTAEARRLGRTGIKGVGEDIVNQGKQIANNYQKGGLKGVGKGLADQGREVIKLTTPAINQTKETMNFAAPLAKKIVTDTTANIKQKGQQLVSKVKPMAQGMFNNIKGFFKR